MTRAPMCKSSWLVCLCVLASLLLLTAGAIANPTANAPLETNVTTKEVKIFGVIYPARFNSAEGDEARYHLLVWQGGTSANALIETPVDDLAFHDALASLGALPGDNLTMSSWNKRYDPNHPEPKRKVEGAHLDIRFSWKEQPLGIPIAQAFQGAQKREYETFPQSQVSSLQSQAPSLQWRFGGNRDRLFNTIPFAPRPGCLACLYSCPSGKVSNRALSVHEYVETPSRFAANTAILPPDGTPVVVTFLLAQ